MEKIFEVKKGENVISVDCQKEKVYFNGNEVVYISFNFWGGDLLKYPFFFIYAVALIVAGNMQDYLDKYFTLYAVVYRDKAKKEHLVVEEYGRWNEIGFWDKIMLEINENVNANVEVAYGINDGKRVNRIVREKISLFGFDINDANNVNIINMGYSVCCYEC